MNERNLTCIVCPMGCNIEVLSDENGIVNIEGNSCPRGKEYAENECTNPVRAITTTIKCENGRILPIKTKRPVQKGKIKEYMDLINNLSVYLEE